ncbi:MAG: ABC transporter substrate-binding protein [Balneolaceae bacterium]|nr:ABC transporter substrate-binding protein [Balneolaceae bacterium]
MKQLLNVSAILLGLALLAVACKQQESVTVNRQPATPSETEPASDSLSGPGDEKFEVLAVGETSPVPSLDPLHARNGATLRAVQLVYEGLTRYDASGNPQPALARTWEVSDDSLTWRFTLETETFYHDSPIFRTGLGRRLQASDVKFAFERMAWNTVPDRAASLFMHIRGFEPFLSEQRGVFNPELRRLGGVGGITVPNDSTVVFRLTEPDPQFLHRLASPYAVIYPPENIRTPYPSQFPAVGTGPYQRTRQQGDSLLIFSRHEPEEGAEPADLPNRVDLHLYDNESELFRALATGRVHLIPHAGPQTLETILEEDGELSDSYRGQYRVHHSDKRYRYRIRHHGEGPLSRDAVQLLASAIDSAAFGPNFPGSLLDLDMGGLAAAGTVELGRDDPEAAMDSAWQAFPADSVYSNYSDDLYLKNFISRWSGRLAERGVGLRMIPIRVPTRSTSLHADTWIPHHPGDAPTAVSPPLVEFRLPRVSVWRAEVEGLTFNAWPWWLDVRGVTTGTAAAGGTRP